MMATVMVRSNDRILKSALELFSDKGYEATSVREICEAAGITKPTLYHFYGSKEGVYRALVEGALERFRGDIHRALSGEVPLRERLGRMARAYVDAAMREPDLARFVMALSHNPQHSAPATDSCADDQAEGRASLAGVPRDLRRQCGDHSGRSATGDSR